MADKNILKQCLLQLEIKALVADWDLAGADIPLGQSSLDTPGVQLTVLEGKAMLRRPEVAANFIRQILLDDADVQTRTTRRVLTLQSVVVNPDQQVLADVVQGAIPPRHEVQIPAQAYTSVLENWNYHSEGDG